MNGGRALAWAAVLMASAALAASDRPSGRASVLERPAAASTIGASAVLLDVARAGARLVAVGERGLVLLSDDDGKSWRQAASSPTSVTLTAVRFASPMRGWATGHAGIILASEDGGDHWHAQLDGKAFAASSLQQAKADVAPANVRAVIDAERLVADGADKPFLDLWFADERHGFAVGAYNLFARTDDGGATWVSMGQRLPNPNGNHLYAIRGKGELIVIAGEQGLLLRSIDGGKTFQALASPYAGSFFTLALLPGGELVVAGLRGNAFHSSDQGDDWLPIKGLPPTSVLASTVSIDGSAWLGNQAGQVFVSRNAGNDWQAVPPQPGPPGAPLTSLLQVAPGTLLTTTLRGIGRIDTQVARN